MVNIFLSELNSAVIAMLLRGQHTKVKELLWQVCDEVETVEEAWPRTALSLHLVHLLLIFFFLLLSCLALCTLPAQLWPRPDEDWRKWKLGVSGTQSQPNLAGNRILMLPCCPGLLSELGERKTYSMLNI